MCAIVGYKGTSDAVNKIFNTLKRMEYRGYDSWGISYLFGQGEENSLHLSLGENTKNSEIETYKEVGEITNIDKIKSNSKLGIGHTRWATHGGVTEANAHPHHSTNGLFSLAQNGIVENYQELKQELVQKGYEFKSETDTEVIVRLIEDILRQAQDENHNISFLQAVETAFKKLEGRNTIIILNKNEESIIAVRHGSPLVVGKNGNETFVASDVLSFANEAEEFFDMDNEELVYIKNDEITFFDIKSGDKIEKSAKKIDVEFTEVTKGDYDHFMLKEIFEQKDILIKSTNQDESQLNKFIKNLKKAKRVYVTGAGTAFYSAFQIAYYLREIAKIPAIEIRSYDSTSYKDIFTEEDILIAISQSGETTDTIECIEFANEKGTKIASYVNMIGSMITKLSDYKFFANAGPEIAVASTKIFSSQVVFGYFLAKSVLGERNEAIDEIKNIQSSLSSISDEYLSSIEELAKEIKNEDRAFILGKGKNTVSALEGALKTKEISYLHFEGFTAGELKHGVIALIEEGTKVFVIDGDDEFSNDILSAAAEVKSRGAYVIGIAKEDNQIFDKHITNLHSGDLNPISAVLPFQLLAYYLALELGYSPDKPRNLAKSVTVK